MPHHPARLNFPNFLNGGGASLVSGRHCGELSMTSERHFACLLCLGLLLAAPTWSGANEPAVSEPALETPTTSKPVAAESCEVPREAASHKLTDKRAVRRTPTRDIVVLNTRGYGYHVGNAAPRSAPRPVPAPAKPASETRD